MTGGDEHVEESHESEVGRHYDGLDMLYRRIWGEGLHHGLWEDGVKSTSEAAIRMTRFVGSRLDLSPGDRLWDVGCGYGGMAAELAGEFGAEAGGITISRKQWEQSVAGVDVRLGDWLENGLPDACYDAVIAIESLEHMSDPKRAIAEMARVVKPGGRVLLGCWMTCRRPLEWERRLLIEPVRRDGLLKGLSHESAIRRRLGKAGLEIQRIDDLSRRVERTWPVCLWRSLRLAAGDREVRRQIWSDPPRSARMMLALMRIWIAYVIGAMRYVVITTRRPL